MMLQAEIAGRPALAPDEYPAKGSIIRDFQVPSLSGEAGLLSSYRGRSNMVLVLAEPRIRPENYFPILTCISLS